MTDHIFTIPADYGCLAIVDPENYEGFVSEDWAIEGLLQHFIAQNQCGSLTAWGCSDGNWNVKIIIGSSNEVGFQSFVSGFKTTGKALLTSYESLTMAAQFEEVLLPETHEIEQVFELTPGNYRITVTQLFQPSQAESDEVFNQKSPHYLVTLELVDEEVPPIQKIPWFAEC